MSGKQFSPSPTSTSYVLSNVRIPKNLCGLTADSSGWCSADILIENGVINTLTPTGLLKTTDQEIIDAKQGIVFSGLVDCHTHLDKAHVGAFTNFNPGNLADAISAMSENKLSWTEENLTQRIEYSLQTAYAYGVRAMRSHVDFIPGDPQFIYEVMRDAVNRWRGKIELQLCSLTNILLFEEADFLPHIYSIAADEGRVGMFLYDQTDLVKRLIPIFEMANANGWDIDLHVDEGLDADLDGLNAVAEVALVTKFKGRVLCGHCVALNVYDAPRRKEVIAHAMEAGLHFVSLPVTNLYLQDRNDGVSPQRRGMAPVRELTKSGATVSLGADNVRDGFSAFGDFDPVAVLNLGAQIGHLNQPARDWSSLITSNPASSLGLSWDGIIETGAPADLVLFSARSSGEMNLSPTAQRTVIRHGQWLKNEMPDFDVLMKDIE